MSNPTGDALRAEGLKNVGGDLKPSHDEALSPLQKVIADLGSLIGGWQHRRDTSKGDVEIIDAQKHRIERRGRLLRRHPSISGDAGMRAGPTFDPPGSSRRADYQKNAPP